MDIKYLGHASFFIKTKNARVVVDPFDPKIGLKFPKTEADIVTISHHHFDHDFLGQINGNPLVLDWPGEYEKEQVRIFGFGSYHDKKKGAERGPNTLFKFEAEGVSILHCGDLGLVPDDTFVEAIGTVDILMVPVGGFFTIDANDAVDLIKKIEPSMVIPMHYGVPGLNQEIATKLAPVDEFLKKMGAEGAEHTAKLTVKEGDFEDENKVVVMDVSSA